MNDSQDVMILEDTEEILHLVIPESPEIMAGERAVDEQAAGCILCEDP